FFYFVRDRALVKSFLEKDRLGALDVILDRNTMRANGSVRAPAAGDQARVFIEERAETVPIAIACRAGDRVVNRRHQMVDRVHVARFSDRLLLRSDRLSGLRVDLWRGLRVLREHR